MRKDRINARLRAFVKEELSPTADDRSFVSLVYGSICDLLGANNCLQIGSFPRYTAIRPLHDLDVLYILDDWTPDPDPSEALTDVEQRIRSAYINPTGYVITVSRQSHSVVISFMDGEEEVFSTDIVPAYRNGINEFGDNMYVVPELVMHSHDARRKLAEERLARGETVGWLRSDPRGYIEEARILNNANEDFRRSAKLVKHWKNMCKERGEAFPLKSFHLELLINRFFQHNQAATIFDAIFAFFRTLPRAIERPHIPDRADDSRYIDQYVAALTRGQKDRIAEACDHVLISLEEIGEDSDVAEMFSGNRYRRAGASEEFLFDQGIPMLTESEFQIIGTVLQANGGFRERLLGRLGLVEARRKIRFTVSADAPAADVYKWKVKNDDKCDQPRGEITDHRTRNDPEETKYSGNHFVECFAINNGVCTGRSRQDVVLR